MADRAKAAKTDEPVDMSAFQRDKSGRNGTPDPESDAAAEETFNAEHPEDDPIDHIEKVGGKVTFGSATEDEDELDEDERQARAAATAKEPPSWARPKMLGMSEDARAINFPGLLMRSVGAGGVDVGFEYKVRGAAIPELVAQIAAALPERQPYVASFAGKSLGEGAIIRRSSQAVDADGNAYCDLVIRLPSSAHRGLGSTSGLLNRGAVLALVPMQETLDLTGQGARD